MGGGPPGDGGGVTIRSDVPSSLRVRMGHGNPGMSRNSRLTKSRLESHGKWKYFQSSHGKVMGNENISKVVMEKSWKMRNFQRSHGKVMEIHILWLTYFCLRMGRTLLTQLFFYPTHKAICPKLREILSLTHEPWIYGPCPKKSVRVTGIPWGLATLPWSLLWGRCLCFAWWRLGVSTAPEASCPAADTPAPPNRCQSLEMTQVSLWGVFLLTGSRTWSTAPMDLGRVSGGTC